MPGIFNPDGYAIAKLIWTLSGDPQPMICTFGVQNVDAALPNPMAIEIDNIYRARFVAGALNTNWTYRGVEVQLGEALGSGGAVGTSVAAVVGTASGEPLPQNSAVLVHKRTAVGGRRGRGRFYLPSGFLAEASVTAVGGISSSLLTSLSSILGNFLFDLNAGGLPMVVLHVQNLNLIPPYVVTSLDPDPIIATQRGRLRR